MRTLKTHQIYASSLMDVMPSLALFYEAGTGKTMCVLDWIYRTVRRNGKGSYLIIGPQAQCQVWRKSIDEMALFEGYDQDGINAVRDSVTITSYGSLGRRRNIGTEEAPVKRIVIKEEYERPWDQIVIDESHGLGGHQSVQTKICLALAKYTPRRYILTGTPISGGGGGKTADYQKLYGQIRFLHPDIWRSWTHFCSLQVARTDQFHKPIGYNEDYCRQLMADNAIVARLQDCTELPDSIVTEVCVNMAERKIAKDFASYKVDKYNISIKAGGTMFVKMLELASGFYIDDDGKRIVLKTDKDDALATILDGTDDKVVIFARYQVSVQRIAQVCMLHGKTVVYDGDQKDDAWEDFQYGDQRYIVCQYQRGNASINLYSSHTTVFYEPCLSALTLEQCMQRTRRTGQTRTCLYHWLITDDCIERKVADAVRSGMEISRDILDRWESEGVSAYQPARFQPFRKTELLPMYVFIQVRF